MQDDTKKPAGGLRWLKRALVSLGGALLLLVLGAGGFLLWLNSDGGHRWLAALISSEADSEQLDLDVAAIEGDIWDRFTLTGVRVADAGGVWLDAPALVVTWSPMALLSGEVHIAKLEGQPLTFMRLPEGGGSQDGEGQDGGGLPVAIRLDAASIAVLYEGDSYRLSLTRLAYGEGRGSGSLALENADSTDVVTAAFTASEDGSAFDLKLDVSARKGGLVTGLLGFSAEDSLTAQASAGGSFRSWTGEMSAEVPGKLDVRAVGGAEAGVWTIGLQQSRNAFVPDVLARALGYAVAADIRLNPRARGGFDTKLELAGNGLQATLTGNLSLTDGISLVDGSVTAALDRLEAAPVAASGIALDGKVSVKDGQVTLPAYRLSAEALTASGSRFTEVELEGDLAVAGGAVSGAAGMLAVTVTPPGLDEMRLQATGGRWNYDMNAAAWSVRVAALEGRGLSARDVAVRGDRSGLKSAAGQAVVPAAFLKRWHGGELTAGQFNVDIRSSGTTKDSTRLTSVVTGSGLSYRTMALDELLGAGLSLEARALIGDDGTVDIETAVLKAARLALDTKGRIDGDQLDLAFHGTVGETEKLLGEGAVLTGDTEFKGSVKGEASAPRVSFETGFASVNAYGVLLQEPTLSLSLAPQKGGEVMAGEVQLTALSALGATEVSSQLRIDGKAVTLNELHLTAPGATGDGGLAWISDGGLAASLKLEMTPLKDARFDLGGDGTMELGFSMREGRMMADLSLDLRTVRFAQPGSFPVTMEAAQGTLRVTNGGDGFGYEADLVASNVSYGAQKLDTLVIKGNSADNDPLHATLAGYFGNRFDLTLTAWPKAGGLNMTFSGTYGDVAAAAEQPINIRWGGVRDLLVEIPRIDLAGGTVAASGSLSGRDMAVSLEARGLAMTMVNLARPGSIESGTLDASIAFNREGGAEVGKVKLDFGDVTLPRWRLAAAPDVYAGTLAATMQDGTVTFEGTMSEAGTEFGRLSGSLPYERLPDSRAYAIRDGAPLAMELVWQGDVAPVWTLARRPEHMLTGRLDGTLTLSGELSDPHFAGDLNLRDGHYEYDPLGLVADIEVLHVTGTQDHIELAELRANDGEDGVLTGKGRFELSSKLSFPGRLEATLENFRVARLDELYGKASAGLVYERTETDATLSGTVRTGPMRVQMPKELPRSVVEIDVVEINGADELEGLEYERKPAKNRPTQLAIAVEVPGQFYFEGRGLKSEWRGDLYLEGTSDEPSLTGNMTVRDGSFTFGSKVFDLTEGVLTFRGGKAIDPDIAVTAVHKTPNLEAQLRILGLSSAPEFTLTSTPALPEDEILSRILLGKSVSDLTAFQLAELVVAMDTLRGGGGLDVVGKLRRGLGLDTLSFGRADGEDENATTVTGGKYLRKNIYLEVETSTASSETATRLKIDLTRNLLVETEIGPRQGSSLKLKWFWDY